MAQITQTQRSTAMCNKGGPEAEELFQLGLSYERGIRGMPGDINKAIQCYEESMEMGNPKAAINLGTLYRYAFVLERETRKERLDYMNMLYKHAIDLGCPDGYHFWATSYYEGWGVKKNIKEGRRLTKIGAEAGSTACMMSYGVSLKKDGKYEEAKYWLQKAVEGKFGYAAYMLSTIYAIEEDAPNMIAALRQGAKLGDTLCLYSLSYIYIYEARMGKKLMKHMVNVLKKF